MVYLSFKAKLHTEDILIFFLVKHFLSLHRKYKLRKKKKRENTHTHTHIVQVEEYQAKHTHKAISVT